MSLLASGSGPCQGTALRSRLEARSQGTRLVPGQLGSSQPCKDSPLHEGSPEHDRSGLSSKGCRHPPCRSRGFMKPVANPMDPTEPQEAAVSFKAASASRTSCSRGGWAKQGGEPCRRSPRRCSDSKLEAWEAMANCQVVATTRGGWAVPCATLGPRGRPRQVQAECALPRHGRRLPLFATCLCPPLGDRPVRA